MLAVCARVMDFLQRATKRDVVLHRLRIITPISEGNTECLSIRYIAPIDTLFPGLGTSIEAIIRRSRPQWMEIVVQLQKNGADSNSGTLSEGFVICRRGSRSGWLLVLPPTVLPNLPWQHCYQSTGIPDPCRLPLVPKA